MTYRIRLLGPFECRGPDGAEIAISGKKPRGVLAYLAAARGKSVSRERLAATFWSLSGEEQARQSLRQCIVALRKAFGEDGRDIIVSEEGSVGLNPDRVDVDIDAVLRTGSDDELMRNAQCAQGVFLKDMVFGEDPVDDWIRDERVRLQAACLSMLFRCAEIQAADGTLDDVVDTYWRVLKLNPASEEAHRALMQTYAQSGRRSEALGQYQACLDALARHLDAVPSAETTALYERLRREPGEAAPQLRRDAPTLPLPDKPAIAVLALDNLSADPAKEYLGDGFSEDITTFLSQFSSLYVISRNSAFAFKGKNLPITEIGRQLGVHYLLEGSIQIAGERIRVTAQLIEADQGTHVWSQRYDGTMDNIFELQDDISQRIVATVVGRIEADALRRARRKATGDLDAYDYVLRGKWHHHRFTAEDSAIAVEMFEKAIEKKPDYVLALGWYACAVGREKTFTMSRSDRLSSPEYLRRVDAALASMKEGLTIDDEESECLRLIGEVALFNRRHDEAKRYLTKAFEVNPNDDRIVSQMSALSTFLGDFEGGERYARLAMRLNPYHPSFYRLNLACALMMLERYDEALETLVTISPMVNRYRAYIAACQVGLGDEARAHATAAEVLAEDPAFSLSHYAKAMLFEDETDTERLLGLMETAGIPR